VSGHATTDDRRQQQHTARLDWLRAHPELVARLPDAEHYRVGKDQQQALIDALRMMKAAQLFAATAAQEDAFWKIRVLVSEILNR
jgi:2-oxo-4-hydroxy-4-carboxy--5-ureidoimidazoline (OHCU) decarboxylase